MIAALLCASALAVDGTADLDTAGRVYTQTPATGVSRGVELVRARAEGDVATDAVGARLALLMAPSGGVDGYVGVNGEAWVPLVELAEGRLLLPGGVTLGGGIVDTPSVAPVLAAWGLPSVAPTLEQRLSPRSDEGGFVHWAHPDLPVTMRLAALAGEGAATRDRNNGVDVAAVLTARPAGPVTILVHGREGSSGIEQGRNHRAGAALWLDVEPVAAGLEAHLGWGYDDDPALEPGGWAVWGRTGNTLPVLAWANLQSLRHHRPDADSSERTLRLGSGPRVGDSQAGSGWVAAGWELQMLGANASATAGQAATVHTFFLQLAVGVSVGSSSH